MTKLDEDIFMLTSAYNKSGKTLCSCWLSTASKETLVEAQENRKVRTTAT